jgi:phosphoglycerate dehydrogenase-like enzyme
MARPVFCVGATATPALEYLEPLPRTSELIRLGGAVTEADMGRIEFLIADGPALAPLIPRMSSLRVIQALSAGVDWLAGRVPDGVHVYNAAGVFDEPLAEWVLAAVLGMQRGFPRAWDAQLRREWEPFGPGQLRGAHVAILGYGAIGVAVERRLKPFGVRLSRIARTSRPGILGLDELDALLPTVDILVVLLPLARSTYRLLDQRRLSLLPRGALLVNAGRGRVVDSAALRNLTATGHLRAALDVVDQEPLPPDDALWSTAGVMITPHIAGDGPESEERKYRLAGEQLRRYAAGRPLVFEVRPYLLEPFESR